MDVCTGIATLDEIPDDLSYPTTATQLTFVADYNNANTPVAITDFTITRSMSCGFFLDTKERN